MSKPAQVSAARGYMPVPAGYAKSRPRDSAGFTALLCLGLLSAITAMGDAPPIEWRGTLLEKGAATFALLDPATGASKWVSIGGAFESYSVHEYDKTKQVLVVLENGHRLELTPSTAIVLPPTPAANGLENLSGMALADALANRGDAELRARLGEHRAAVLARDETIRRVVAEERVQRTRERMGASNPAMALVATEGESSLIKLRTEVRRQDAEIERLANEISAVAVQKRAALAGQ